MHTNHIIRSRPFALLVCSLATLVPLSGCFSYQRAQGEPLPAEALAPDAWPVFETSPELRELMDTPEVIERYALNAERLREMYPELTDEELAEARSLLAEDLIRSELVQGGLFRAWVARSDAMNASDKRVIFSFGGRLERFLRSGSYLTSSVEAYERRRSEIRSSDESLKKLGQLFASTRGLTNTDAEDRWRLDDGLIVGLPESVPEEPAGVVLHITSLIENKYEHNILRRMESYGWAVAHLDSDIYVNGPNDLAAQERKEQQRKRERELYDQHPDNPSKVVMRENRVYTDAEVRLMGEIHRELWEQVREELPSVDRGFEIHPGDDIDSKARLIASAIDTRLAEHAYASEALIDTLDALHPELAQKPVVVMGFSAGALTAPTIAARLHEVFPDRKVLLVMIGGGGDLLSISRQSTMARGGIYLEPESGPEPSPEQLTQLQASYEAQVRFDPLVVASAIRDVPVLHIYGNTDTVIPTAAAERFNAAHANVDRLIHKGDHDTLFYFMSGQAGKIRSWLRDHGVE